MSAAWADEQEAPKAEPFEQWAIVELMGHVRLGGRLTEESHFGVALGRIDIPAGDGFATQFFGGSSIYRITPVAEDVARAVATANQPQPVHRWELPAPAARPAPPATVIEDHEFVSDEEGDCAICGQDIGSAVHDAEYREDPF
jgi:hypothetical protein